MGNVAKFIGGYFVGAIAFGIVYGTVEVIMSNDESKKEGE